MSDRIIVHIEGEDGDDRDVYWDLPTSDITAIFLQELLTVLGPATGELPVEGAGT